MAYYYALHLTEVYFHTAVLLQTEILQDSIHDRDSTPSYKKALGEWKSFIELHFWLLSDEVSEKVSQMLAMFVGVILNLFFWDMQTSRWNVVVFYVIACCRKMYFLTHGS